MGRVRRAVPSGGQEFCEGGGRVAGDECLAYEHDVCSGIAVVRDIRWYFDRGLCDADDAGRDEVGEGAEQVLVELERRQVTGVDPDETCPDLERALHFGCVVGFYESSHT